MKLSDDSDMKPSFHANSSRIDSRDNYMILSSNADQLFKIICMDACEGLNITTVSPYNHFNQNLAK